MCPFYCCSVLPPFICLLHLVIILDCRLSSAGTVFVLLVSPWSLARAPRKCIGNNKSRAAKYLKNIQDEALNKIALLFKILWSLYLLVPLSWPARNNLIKKHAKLHAITLWFSEILFYTTYRVVWTNTYENRPNEIREDGKQDLDHIMQHKWFTKIDLNSHLGFQMVQLEVKREGEQKRRSGQIC